MRKVVWTVLVFLGAAVAGTAEAQYYDRHGPGRDYRDSYRDEHREERREARQLMRCAGYIAQIRTYREHTDTISRRGEERAEAMEVRFTRESDRISGGHPNRERWYQQGVRDAQDDIRAHRRYPDRLRSVYWDRVRECRDLSRH